jgi:hypothetical protein
MTNVLGSWAAINAGMPNGTAGIKTGADATNVSAVSVSFPVEYRKNDMIAEEDTEDTEVSGIYTSLSWYLPGPHLGSSSGQYKTTPRAVTLLISLKLAAFISLYN